MARMIHDWSGEGQSIPPAVKAVAVVVGAFLVTGILYFVVQQAMSVASNRVGNRYARFDENRPDAAGPINPTFTSPGMPLNGPQRFGAPGASSSGQTGGIMRFSQAVPTTVTATPGASTIGLKDAFTNDGERERARQQVKQVRATLTVLKQYDGRSLWSNVSLLENARKAATVAQSEPGTLTLGSYDTPEDADAAKNALTRKLMGELEAINADVALTTHPERFPEPLHDGAEAVGGAMRTYLETARMAVARPYEADVLKNRAAKELTHVEDLVRAMELPLTGGASAAN